ncbi:MAG: NAD(P)-dependent oxidoreductase [Deltaproteobacteria bacterium]|nr:NAD(P)-dependent oxidoreductase [Deltaproteobacteria bacterium]
MTEKVGFAGTGLMGRGMAKNILSAGYPLAVVAHRSRESIEQLVGLGATELRNHWELAAESDVVFLCVTGTPEVESIVYGRDGLLEGAHYGLTVVDCSTSEPASSARIAADLDKRGASFVDAPLARTPAEAEAGRLNTMVGANDEDFARVRPLLDACCENIFHMGPVGSGHKTKLIYNFITMGYAALISEAMCACAATGVDLKRFSDVVSAGGANSGIFQLIVPKAIESGDCSGLNFSLANAEKDLRYYNQMADAVPLSGNLGRAVQHALIQGLNLGYANGLVGDLLHVQEKLNGLAILKRIQGTTRAPEDEFQHRSS